LLASHPAVGLGAVTNGFDLLQKRIPVLLTNGFAEQLPQHMDIFTQTHIDIGHWPSLWRSLGALVQETALGQECPQPSVDGKRPSQAAIGKAN
jgi:hypothetical protein